MATSGPADSPPPLRHPILLVHGLGGFDQMRLDLLKGYSLRIEYFKGIGELLESQGAPKVYAAALPPGEAIEARGAALKRFAERRMGAARYHIIAHSMGGLDSRYYLTHLGGGERVVSLTTLGTPHRGSALANLTADRLLGPCARLIEKAGMEEVFGRLQASTAAHRDLRPEDCRAFNEATPDQPGVTYFSYAGDPPPEHVPWFLRMPYEILLRSAEGGPNDGLVTVESARWSGWRGSIVTDHVSMVGWQFSEALRRGFDVRRFYLSLLDNLRLAEQQG